MPRSLGIRNNPNKDERERTLKRAALKIYVNKGYQKATMEEIALEAGFGKGTLYWYWKSKEDLFFALISDVIQDFQGLIEKAAGLQGGFWEKIAWLKDKIVDLYYRDREYCKLYWKVRAVEIESFSPQNTEEIYRMIKQFKKTLAGIVQQGIDEKILPRLDPYFLACFILGWVEGMEIQWLEEPESFDLDRAMDMAMQMFTSISSMESHEVRKGQEKKKESLDLHRT